MRPVRLFDHVEDRDAVALDDGTTQVSFRALDERIASLVATFHGSLGLSPGDHVAIHLRNRTAFAELILASIASGVWVTPMNWHLAPDEIAYVLQDSGAKVVFVDASTRESLPSTSARVVDVDVDLPSGSRRRCTRARWLGGAGRDDDLHERNERAAEGREADEAADARRIDRDPAGRGATFGLDGRGPHLLTGPMYHAAPLLFALYDLLNGATMIILPRWDEREALSIVASRRVRHVHLVPTMFVRLLRLPEEERAAFDASALTLVMHGAAPITPATKRAMIAWWGPVLLEYWGATEGGIYTLATSEEWLAHEGTVGRPIGAFEVFAVGESGERLGTNEIGTLYCRHRTSALPFEYHGDRAKTESSYLEPHVFTAGDLGHVDDEGFVYLSARRSNLILTGGVNVYPAEVERVLSEHPLVVDVAVFGVPDPEWGETVRAAIELVEGTEPSTALVTELLAFARQRLAGFKVPRAIDFHAKLPRTTAGKIRVQDLVRRPS